jgi:hypothetical protein
VATDDIGVVAKLDAIVLVVPINEEEERKRLLLPMAVVNIWSEVREAPCMSLDATVQKIGRDTD